MYVLCSHFDLFLILMFCALDPRHISEMLYTRDFLLTTPTHLNWVLRLAWRVTWKILNQNGSMSARGRTVLRPIANPVVYDITLNLSAFCLIEFF